MVMWLAIYRERPRATKPYGLPPTENAVTKNGARGSLTSTMFILPPVKLETYAYLPESAMPYASPPAYEPTSAGADGLLTSSMTRPAVVSPTYAYWPATATESAPESPLTYVPTSVILRGLLVS